MTNHTTTVQARNEMLTLMKIIINSDTLEAATHTITKNTNWNKVVQLASEQTVLGIALKAALQLPTDILPPQTILMQWHYVAELIKKRNDKLNHAMKALADEFTKADIQYIFVKGQIAAKEYDTNANYRTPGDIDIFFDTNNWTQTQHWAQENNISLSLTAIEKHAKTKYHGINTEMHFHLKTFASTKANSYWQQNIENKAIANARTVNINSEPMPTLNTTDTLVYLLVHAHTHLLTEGLGLRQLIDLTLFLKNHHNDIDRTTLTKHLTAIDHTKAFSAYCALMHKHLALPIEYIPCTLQHTDYVHADNIMNTVWQSGNFGYKNTLHGKYPTIINRINTARLIIQHSLRFYPLAPHESRGLLWKKLILQFHKK